jgi:hypothetical protein
MTVRDVLQLICYFVVALIAAKFVCKGWRK